MLYQIFNIVPNVTVPDSYLTCTDTKCELCANLCLLFQKKTTPIWNNPDWTEPNWTKYVSPNWGLVQSIGVSPNEVSPNEFGIILQK